MSDVGYLLAASAVVWVGIFLYVFSLSSRQRSLERDIARLKGEMEEGERRP